MELKKRFIASMSGQGGIFFISGYHVELMIMIKKEMSTKHDNHFITPLDT
jgi:hypothetical protein